MQGKTYDTMSVTGAELWLEVNARLSAERASVARLVKEHGLDVLSGKKYLRSGRLGQGSFRLMTLENYSRKCCITGESTLPVLEAAHIRPVTQEGNHALQNGLLLRADMHILYDKGLIGIDGDYKVHVSEQIAELYVNGRVYYSHAGASLASLPRDPELRPDRDLLAWHMETVFAA